MSNEMFDALGNGHSDFLPPIDFRFDSRKALDEAFAALDKVSGCGLETDLTMNISLTSGEVRKSSTSFAGLDGEDLSFSFDSGAVLNSILKTQREEPVDPFGGLGDVFPESQETGYFSKSVCKNAGLRYQVGDEVWMKDDEGPIRIRLTKVSSCGPRNSDSICINWEALDVRRSGSGITPYSHLAAA